MKNPTFPPCPVTACPNNVQGSCLYESVHPVCQTRISVKSDAQDSANENYYDLYFALKAKYEAVVKEFNERLIDRTTGMLDSLAKPRLSAASFLAGWEASMDFASGGTSNLEQALQQHLDTKTTDYAK